MTQELPTFETERLILREIMVSDASNMFEYAKLSSVGPVAGWEPHTNINETKLIIQLMRDKKKYGQLGVFAIILKSENKMIGTLELHTYVPKFKATLGYALSPYYWGQGIVVEAALELLKWGFITLQLSRIDCEIFTSNLQSQRVCEKLHLQFEGIKKKAYLLYDGTVHDLYCYALTNDEYFKIYRP